jgi:hypothetical protein
MGYTVYMIKDKEKQMTAKEIIKKANLTPKAEWEALYTIDFIENNGGNIEIPSQKNIEAYYNLPEITEEKACEMLYTNFISDSILKAKNRILNVSVGSLQATDASEKFFYEMTAAKKAAFPKK